MSDCFLGEIRLVGFPKVPSKWAACQGALLPINENQALYSLIGTRFGGNGVTTMGLPDLRGRLPLGQGTNPRTGTSYQVGLAMGRTDVTLTEGQMPTHSHGLGAEKNGQADTNPDSRYPGGGTVNIYADSSNGQMAADAVTRTGGNQSHNNMMPYLTMNFIIALAGLYPTRT